MASWKTKIGQAHWLNNVFPRLPLATSFPALTTTEPMLLRCNYQLSPAYNWLQLFLRLPQVPRFPRFPLFTTLVKGLWLMSEKHWMGYSQNYSNDRINIKWCGSKRLSKGRAATLELRASKAPSTLSWGILKRSFRFTLTWHENAAFRKHSSKWDQLENADFPFSCGRETFCKRSFSKMMTSP